MSIKYLNSEQTVSFFDIIKKRARERRSPFNVMFELTHRCNFKCPYCYLKGVENKKGEELNTGQVLSILDQMKDAGVFVVGFTGGEPLIRKDIFEIINYANKSGLKTCLFTNGYLIDEKAADRLKKTNINRIDITFNAMEARIFDVFTGVKGSIEKVRNAVNILIGNGMAVSMKSLCTTLNRDEVVKIARYARSLNIPYSIDGDIELCLDGCADWKEKYSVSVKELLNIRRKIHPEMFKGNGEKIRMRPLGKNRIFRCSAGTTTASINPYGKMNFCQSVDYPGYNILSMGLEDSWEKLKGEVDRLNTSKGNECDRCDLIKYCISCPAKSYIMTGSFNKCVPFFKARALEKKVFFKKKED